MNSVVYTVGHSTHKLGRFLDLLLMHDVEAVADVRSTPYSARWAAFNREPLRRDLKAVGIAYVFLGEELGGRAKADTVVNELGRVLYREMAASTIFRFGLDRLESGAQMMRVAMMCSEGDPLFCHRGLLISRELAARGSEIRHIHRDGLLERHVDAERRLTTIVGRAQDTELFRSTRTTIDDIYAAQEERVAWVSEPVDEGRLA